MFGVVLRVTRKMAFMPERSKRFFTLQVQLKEDIPVSGILEDYLELIYYSLLHFLWLGAYEGGDFVPALF